MWANAQHDGRPAEYRRNPLFNATKFGWRPLLECRAVTLSRRETRWNLQGCPKLANRSQPSVGRSSPYYQHMWRRYRCLTSFFPIVNTCFSSEDIARQSEKNLLSSNISATCPHNMLNFGPLAAEIVSLVWGTPGNFNGFRVLAALLHSTLVVGVSQTAALNRGRHLYSAWRPSLSGLTHISIVLTCISEEENV